MGNSFILLSYNLLVIGSIWLGDKMQTKILTNFTIQVRTTTLFFNLLCYVESMRSNIAQNDVGIALVPLNEFLINQKQNKVPTIPSRNCLSSAAASSCESIGRFYPDGLPWEIYIGIRFDNKGVDDQNAWLEEV